MISGFILIIIGIVFLLQNFGYISEEAWSIIWPAILIVIGLEIILKRKNQGFFWKERFGWSKKDYNPPTTSSRSSLRSKQAPIKEINQKVEIKN